MSHLNLINDFREVVASVFGSWTALQLAIANGPGGLSSQEIVANMIEGVTQLICGNENIDSYEVADMLHEMMDENFQTICEDDSPEEVGGVLCQYYLKCRSGEKHLVDLELNNVKKVASSTSQRMPSRSTNIEVTTNGEIVKCLTNRRGQCKSTDLFQEPRISEANGGTETNDNSGKESDAKPLVLVEDMDVDGLHRGEEGETIDDELPPQLQVLVTRAMKEIRNQSVPNESESAMKGSITMTK